MDSRHFKLILKSSKLIKIKICQVKKGRILSKKAIDKKIVEVLYDPEQANHQVTENSITFKITN